MSNQQQKSTLRNFRASEATHDKFQKKANRYTNGNLSEWLRLSGTKYVPPVKAEKTQTK